MPGWVLRCLHQAAMDKSQEGSRAMGRGRARRQLPSCPSLPALPGRGVTSSTGFCQALPGAGALPCHGLSVHSWVLQERTAWDLGSALCQCHAGLTAPAPGVPGGNWAVSSERAPIAGEAPGEGSGLFFACRRRNKSHTSRNK